MPQEKTEEKVEKLNKDNIYTGLKVIIKYITEFKVQLIVLIVLGILSAIGNATVPYIAGRFFDSINSDTVIDLFGNQLPAYAVLLIIWAIIQAITYTIDWRNEIMSQYLSNKIWLNYLSRGFSYVLNLPISFHKKNKMGEIGETINIAANSLETIVGRHVIDIAPQLLSIIIALIIAMYINIKLAFILVSALIIYIFVLSLKIRPVAEYHKEYRKNVRELFGDAYDSILNTHAIKQSSAEEYERDKLQNKSALSIPLWMRLSKVWSTLSLYQKIIILITQISIFIISIINIRNGIMTLGELLSFNAYTAMIFGPFMSIARDWQSIQGGIINIQKTENILGIPAENYAPKDAPNISITGQMEFKNVNYSYESDKPVLQNINFKVNAGEVIALVGESGVGKSTLVDLISGYHFPVSGEVLIEGYDIRKINLRKLRESIAIVPQEVVLFNDTIKKNIKYGNFNSTDEEMEIASKKAHAYDFIMKFPSKWEQMVGERGVKLSVGQKQRVAIARAILRNPKILILDEPTSALDAGSEKIISDSLDELMKGKTTFIIAHRLSTVRKADKILVFKEGKIIESGKHDELLKIEGGEYRRLYELQIGLTA